MELKITIEDATHNELQEIKKLFYDTVTKICKKDYTAEQIKAWASAADDEAKWADKIIKQYFLVAKADDKVIGFASLENDNYLDYLYVHKDFQRKGVAQKLLSLLEKKAEINRNDKIICDVSITAKPFFEQNGYKVIKEQKNKINGVTVPNFRMIKKLGYYVIQ